MKLNDIKKVLYKEKPTAKVTAIYRDGGSKDYETITSLGVIKFHVPINEQKGLDGTVLNEFQADNIEAKLLIKWIKLQKN